MSRKLLYLLFCTLLLSLSVSASAAEKGWWKFDDGSGTTAADSSGNSKTGTLNNMTDSDWVTGRIGNYCLDFDGSDDSVTVPSLGITSVSASICAWVKRSGAAEAWGGIVFRQSGGIWFGINIAQVNDLGYHWNAANWQWTSGLVLPDNKWVFVTLAVESTKATMYMMNDGVILSKANTATHTAEDWTGSMRIGRAGDYSPGRLFKGQIDNVRIFDTTLTSSNIRSTAQVERLAWNPIPVPSLGVDKTSLVLKWTAGDYAQATNEHLVYFGTNSADVDSATTSSAVYMGTRDVNNYTPTLADGIQYYWRIDEIDTASTVWKGYVWNFGTFWDVKPDTWVAVDDYSRVMPDVAVCGSPRTKTVGIFYFLWLGQHGTDGPFNITDCLAANPSNPPYGPVGTYHHWCKSELGYYLSTDDYVIRRHAQQLSDAGVDCVAFDVTNGPSYNSVYMKLCSIWRTMRAEGQKTPKVTFITNSDAVNVVSIVYNDFYKPGYYKELWQYWQGKPLIFSLLTGHSTEIANFFTIKRIWAWTYGLDTWNFMDYTPQRIGYDSSSQFPEETSASMAQHPTTNIGRSYQGGSQPSHDSYALTGYEHQGRYFAEQSTRALNVDPDFLFVTGWNEWVAGRLTSDGTVSMHGELVPSGGSVFVDAFNKEYSRDGEPLDGYYTDNYYYQMANTIRKYKGVRAPDTTSAATTPTIDGSFSDWDSVTPQFRDTKYDTTSRSQTGWGTAGTYTNTTGRNDIVAVKVARDATYIYFYIETRENITAYTDTNWMLIFIDRDQDHSTGWEGYDYVINYGGVGASTTTLKSNSGGTFTWNTVSSNNSYAKSGNKMELRISRSEISETGTVAFDFHLHDNMVLSTIKDFFVNGDSAPNRRFNYRYEQTADTITSLFTDGFETNFDKWTDGGTTDWTRTTGRKFSGSYSATCSPTTNDLISDNINTSGKESIRVSFKYMDDDIDADDDIYLQFYDGTAYDNIYELDMANASEDIWMYYSGTKYNTGGDNQYFISNFRIKFEGTSCDTGENLWIDDVLVTSVP